MPYSNVNHLMLRDQNRGRACVTVIIDHHIDAAKLSHHTFAALTQIDRVSRAKRWCDNAATKNCIIFNDKTL